MRCSGLSRLLRAHWQTARRESKRGPVEHRIHTQPPWFHALPLVCSRDRHAQTERCVFQSLSSSISAELATTTVTISHVRDDGDACAPSVLCMYDLSLLSKHLRVVAGARVRMHSVSRSHFGTPRRRRRRSSSHRSEPLRFPLGVAVPRATLSAGTRLLASSHLRFTHNAHSARFTCTRYRLTLRDITSYEYCGVVPRRRRRRWRARATTIGGTPLAFSASL